MDNITQGNIIAITLDNSKLNIKYEQESHVCITVNFFFLYRLHIKGKKSRYKKSRGKKKLN